MTQYHRIYPFGAYTRWLEENHTEAEAKRVLGGKGAALVSMLDAGLPVPPGFTITTEVCNAYRSLGDTAEAEAFFPKLMDEVSYEMLQLKEQIGYMPLVSVRSGAPVSMPGMMDTILNVGLTHDNMSEWVDRIGVRPAFDSYRRLIQMLGATAFGINALQFEKLLTQAKAKAGVEMDSELDEVQLDELTIQYEELFESIVKVPFPDTLETQLDAAIQAVFKSWMNPRAIEYRKQNGLKDDMGTACTVQVMVFGNTGPDSGSGVLFTRHPATGENVIMGEYLANAQGEDVVAGVRTPVGLGSLTPDEAPWMPELEQVCENLEQYYRDMVDLEFTVQDKKLYILQSRVGKRSAGAAIKIAVDLVAEQVIPIGTALKRVTTAQYKLASRPMIDPKFKGEADFVGLPACPGVATGRPVFSSQEAVDAEDDVILVTHETDPDDIAGMGKAVGILTKTGGATSHAAVVARAMDKPCVVGCTDLDFSKVGAATKISICGATGRVWVEVDLPLIDASGTPEMATFQQMCLEQAGLARYDSFPPDDWTGGHPFVVTAQDWWDDKEVAQAALDVIAALETREGLILDLRHPASLVPTDDLVFETMFSASKAVTPMDTQFQVTVLGSMKAFPEGSFAGLTVISNLSWAIGSYEDWAAKTGAIMPKAPTNLMQCMSDDIMAPPTPEFLKNVFHTDEAWAKFLELRKLAGKPFKTLPQASAPEYGVFKALRSA